MNAEVIPRQKEIAAYSEFQSQLAELEAENKSLVFDYADPKGNKDARSHIYKLRRSKGALETLRKEEKKAALEYGRLVDSEAAKLEARIEAMIIVHETPLREIEEMEKARIANIESNLDAIIEIGIEAERDWQTMNVDHMQAFVKKLTTDPMTEEVWQEYLDGAARAGGKTILQIQDAIAKRQKYDAEQAELAELRRQAAEREAKEAAERAAREQKERDESIAREAAEKAKREAEEKAATERKEAERIAEQARLKAENEAREQRQRAEAAELATQQAKREAAEAEARAKADAERKEREAREEQARREADAKHRVSIINEAAASLKALKPTDSVDIINAIAAGKVQHVKVLF